MDKEAKDRLNKYAQDEILKMIRPKITDEMKTALVLQMITNKPKELRYKIEDMHT